MQKRIRVNKKPDEIYGALAEKLFYIWKVQDSRDFDELERSARDLFQLLGYTKEESEFIANRVSVAHKFYAELDDRLPARIDGKAQKKEIRHFESKINELLDVFQHKNRRRLAKHHAKWWIYFFLQGRTQKIRYYLLAASHIFVEHCLKIGDVFPALQCSYYLVMAGYRGHNRRHEQTGIDFLTKYWKTYLENDPEKPLMF